MVSLFLLQPQYVAVVDPWLSSPGQVVVVKSRAGCRFHDEKCGLVPVPRRFDVDWSHCVTPSIWGPFCEGH